MQDNWRDLKYREVFEQTLKRTRFQLAYDPAFTMENVQGLLQSQYEYKGQDWVGRGAVIDVTIAATIAAYELILAETSAILQ